MPIISANALDRQMGVLSTIVLAEPTGAMAFTQTQPVQPSLVGSQPVGDDRLRHNRLIPQELLRKL